MNQVRVIGGRWRGRKLPVADLPGLRPTGDRIRETLFNWLTPTVEGAHCLDLFAGSGALSLEALSRGANRAVCLDNQPAVVSALLAIGQQLEIVGFEPIQQDALAWLKRPAANTNTVDSKCDRFDIIFLDPPFESKLLQPAIDALAASDCVKDGALVYIERSRTAEDVRLSDGWEMVKDKQTGNIRFSLIEVTDKQR